MTNRSPMFPLSTVLFPGGMLPLHVFEPRYRALVHECLKKDREFGIVLISRGSEVGGGDERLDVGTSARIEASAPSPDGRWALIVRGTRRIRIVRWLEDDPYPQALIEDLPTQDGSRDDEEQHEGDTVADERDRSAFEAAWRSLRRLNAMSAELGRKASVQAAMTTASNEPAEPEVLYDAVDLDEAGWRLCALAPFTALDQQRLLEAPDLVTRLSLFTQLSRELADDLEKLLAAGSA